MGKQKTPHKRVFPVYGPTWVDKLRHSGRKMTTTWFKMTIICQSDSKMTPNWQPFAKKSEFWWFVLPLNFIKPLKYVRNMSVSWKQTFMYPKWLHNYLKVDPKWSKVTFIRQRWPQSDPKVTPNWGQTHKWKSKVRHRNVYFRFMDPLGSTSYTTVAAKLTTRWSKGTIICQSDSKITPKVTTFCEKVKMLMICVTP